MEIIARIHNHFPTKFGLPRQSGLVHELQSVIVFEPTYRVAEALRGLEGYSHLWLLWQFHMAQRENWSPTVRPPRLGGNKRMGVFATRSPFRPNPIGLSCVKLERIEHTPDKGTVLHVSGADLMDGTPIYDIKPYLPFADCIPEATGGFAQDHLYDDIEVVFPDKWLQMIPEEHRAGLIGALRQDPRPAYQNDPERIYGFLYAEYDVRFVVANEVLTVCEIIPNQ
ncbi:MAG: tRNA (N6-threonylcarbamoyladenosine(37)-N6)-methyltransferase TrmO [Clostridiales bacterium]|nr:tRNA (N6-threonylcarbamoyladenosine(37)-N6)-methyltransferase TrmO [Clostridiales bacterium]